MTLSELMEQIEGRRFDAYLNAASGLSVLRMALEDSPFLRDLIAELQAHPENAQRVSQRISDLLKTADQPDYSFDAALAAYLFALSRVDSALTHKAIEAILQTPQLWWARRLAQHLQTQIAHEQQP